MGVLFLKTTVAHIPILTSERREASGDPAVLLLRGTHPTQSEMRWLIVDCRLALAVQADNESGQEVGPTCGDSIPLWGTYLRANVFIPGDTPGNCEAQIQLGYDSSTVGTANDCQGDA